MWSAPIKPPRTTTKNDPHQWLVEKRNRTKKDNNTKKSDRLRIIATRLCAGSKLKMESYSLSWKHRGDGPVSVSEHAYTYIHITYIQQNISQGIQAGR